MFACFVVNAFDFYELIIGNIFESSSISWREAACSNLVKIEYCHLHLIRLYTGHTKMWTGAPTMMVLMRHLGRISSHPRYCHDDVLHRETKENILNLFIGQKAIDMDMCTVRWTWWVAKQGSCKTGTDPAIDLWVENNQGACIQEFVSNGRFGRSKYRVRAKIVSRTSWNYWYVVCLPSVSIGLLIVTSLKV